MSAKFSFILISRKNYTQHWYMSKIQMVKPMYIATFRFMIRKQKKVKHIRLLLLVLPAGRQSATETVSVHITITVRSLGTNCTRTRNIPSPHGKDIVFISTSYYDKFFLVHETPVRASGLSTMASIMILI